MRITSDNFLRATVNAMCEDNVVKLIKGVPGTMKMFTLFSTLIMCEIEDNDIDEDKYDEIVSRIVAEITPEDADVISMLKMLSLMTFADDIYENLKSVINSR